MLIYPWKIDPVNLYINQNYKNRTTHCRFKKNEMEFTIEKTTDDGIITLEYEVVFESITTCDIVAEVTVKVIAKFIVSKFKDDDLIVIERFLTEVYLKIEKYLKNPKNIPLEMISTLTPLISKDDIQILKTSVFAELTRQGLYH